MNTGETPQADPAEVTEVQETPSIRRVGQQLRDAREAKGLNVAEIAARLKLTQRQIEALEADDAVPVNGNKPELVAALTADDDTP